MGATDARREPGGHFRSVFDASAIAIALVGTSGRIQRANPAFGEMMGCAPESLHGRAFGDLMDPNDMETAATGFAELVAGTRHDYHGEQRLRRDDGGVVWARVAVTVPRAPSGAATGVLVMAEDITAARVAREERDRLFHDLGERVKEATALHGTSRILQDASLQPEESLRHIVALLPPAFHFPEITVARIRFGGHDARTQGFVETPRRLSSPFRTHDGTEGSIDVHLTTAPPTGMPEFLVEEQRLLDSIAESLTVAIDHRRAMQALQRSEERLHLTLKASRVGIWEWDLASARITWSPELEALAGLAPGAFDGTFGTYRELVHPEDVDEVRRAVNKAIEDPDCDDAFESEFRMRQPDGSYRWCLSRGRVMRDARGQPTRLLGLTHDISGLRELQRQFQQAQKMEALGRLAGGIAHDFNNLLSVMRGCLEFIQEDLDPADPHAADVQELNDATERAATLTRQLLAFSRTQALDRRAVDANVAVRGMENLLRRLIGRQVELVVDLEPTVGMVRIDPGQLEQVVMNLAVNARDAMPDGGRLTIQTRTTAFADRVTFAGFELTPGRYVALQVSDSGTGMSTEVQARLFEAFFTTKEVGRGTGLGLATVHGIVQQAHGAIFVYSEIGHGSTFKVYLPWISEGDAPRTEANPRATGTAGTETVVLVDDDDGVRALADRALRGAGYTVHAFGNPVEALSFVRLREVAVDLLITDIVMPRLQGPELATATRRAHPAARVLFVTGFSDRPIETDPGSSLLQKPFAPSGLLASARELLDRPPRPDTAAG